MDCSSSFRISEGMAGGGGPREMPKSSGQHHSAKRNTPREVDAVPPEQERFVTAPMIARSAGGVRSTGGMGTSPFATAHVSSRPLAPDAPTPAVPLASLLEEAQEDRLWGGAETER